MPRTITMPVARINAVLGTQISREEAVAVLRRLDMVVVETGDSIQVTVPSFRFDLLEEMDLIEEVARIYGYEHIPTTVPGRLTGSGRIAPEMAFEGKIRELMTSIGLFEMMSFSLVDYRLLDLMLLPEDAPERREIVALRNPKSEEYTHLRPTMLVSMLDALRNNARRNIDDVQLFELARVFRATGGGFRFDYARENREINHDVRVQDAERLPREQRSLGIALMGRPYSTRWGGGDIEVDFYWLKGILEQMLQELSIPSVSFIAAMHPSLHPGRTAEIRSGDRVLGVLGEVHPRVNDNFDLTRRAYVAELDIDALMDVEGAKPPVESLSRYPAVSRDIAFLIQISQSADAVQAAIETAAGSLLESVELFDVYLGKSIPEGWRSLAYRITFRADDRTLADEEVDAAMTRVRQVLIDTVGANLR